MRRFWLAVILLLTALVGCLIYTACCSGVSNECQASYTSRHGGDRLTRGWLFEKVSQGGKAKLLSGPPCNLRHCGKLSLQHGVSLRDGFARQGNWWLEPGQMHALGWEPKECRLRRLSAQQAAQCLSGQRIAFIGDSVTRYQFTSLAYFLTHGVYQHPFDPNTTEPSVTNSNQWPDWSTFFMAPLLNNGATSTATCYGCQHENSTGGFDPQEHWHYSLRHTGRGPEAAVNMTFDYLFTRPSYLQAGLNAIARAFGVDPPKASSQPGSSKQLRGHRHGKEKKGHSQGRVLTSTQPGGTAQTVQSQSPGVTQPPTILVFNMGIWIGDSISAKKAVPIFGQFFKYGAELAARTGTQLIWKTTTTDRWDQDEYNEAVAKAAHEAGWQVLDFRGLIASAQTQGLLLQWHKKTVHFYTEAYEQANDLLLNALC